MTAEAILIDHIQRTLPNLNSSALPNEYFYESLPLCVIDAVFSIQTVYGSTQRTVRNWCAAQNPPWAVFRSEEPSPWAGGNHTVSEFVSVIERNDYSELAEKIFKNRQRTSSRSGILKAEAVYRFAKALAAAGIETFGDTSDSRRNAEAQLKILEIPGQRSGITFRYFLMLAGSDVNMKPDSMVRRFVSEALGLKALASIDQAEALVVGASATLKASFPDLTPRLLDYEIWKYQRSLPAPAEP